MRGRWGPTFALLAIILLSTSACGGGEGGTSENGREGAAGRVIEHAMGASEVSGTLEQAVVLDTGELDSVISLGVEPVGSVATDGGVEIAGTIEQPNLVAHRR